MTLSNALQSLLANSIEYGIPSSETSIKSLATLCPSFHLLDFSVNLETIETNE